MFVGQMAVMANGFIDTIMAGRYSTLDLAGVGVGSSIYMSIFVAMMGILLALTPTAAQLYGAGRHGEIGEEVRQSSWLALALTVLCFLALQFPDPFFVLTKLEPEVEVRTRAYLSALSWSVPAALAFRVFYGFSSAVSRTRSIMVLNLAGLLFKIPLNLVMLQNLFDLCLHFGICKYLLICLEISRLYQELPRAFLTVFLRRTTHRLRPN